MHVMKNGKPLEKVDCFNYLGSHVATDKGCERDVVQGIKEEYRPWGVPKVC